MLNENELVKHSNYRVQLLTYYGEQYQQSPSEERLGQVVRT